MAAVPFDGYLLYVKKNNQWVALPMQYVKAESYTVTPKQRMESEANRSVTGYLTRTTCEHVAVKVEIETTDLTNKQLAEVAGLFQQSFTNVLQRNITIKYYDPELDDYTEADCYMPDTDYPIKRVDVPEKIVYYGPIRYAFIEY